MSLLQAFIDRVLGRTNPTPQVVLAISDDGSADPVAAGKLSPLRADPTTGELLVKSSGGGGGGGGAVTQSTGSTSTPWYVQGVNGGSAERLATYAAQIEILARIDPVWSALQSGFVGSKIAKLNTYFGQRTTFANTTQYHDVFSYLSSAAAYGGDMTGTEALEIVSSSINDTSAGTCARTIAYCYIDALNGDVETIATATLNGTTAVALGAGVRAKNIQWMEIRTTGSATHNEGTITLRTAGAGTTWEQIPALQRRSMSARYMVPTGYTAFVCNPCFSAQGQRMQFAILTNESEDGVALGATYTVHNLSSIPANFAGAPISGVIHKFAAGTRIKIAAIPASTAGSPIAETEFTILLVQN